MCQTESGYRHHNQTGNTTEMSYWIMPSYAFRTGTVGLVRAVVSKFPDGLSIIHLSATGGWNAR
jgi:hypothetical protein